MILSTSFVFKQIKIVQIFRYQKEESRGIRNIIEENQNRFHFPLQ